MSQASGELGRYFRPLPLLPICLYPRDSTDPVGARLPEMALIALARLLSLSGLSRVDIRPSVDLQTDSEAEEAAKRRYLDKVRARAFACRQCAALCSPRSF